MQKGLDRWVLLRALATLAEDRFHSQHPQDSSQASVTPVPGESIALFWPLRVLHVWYIDT